MQDHGSSRIGHFHIAAWSDHGVAADDDELEVAITDEWRREMKEARESRRPKITQADLGKLVDADQETISMIENVNAARPIRSSKYVIKIARELKIPPPLHHLDDWQRYWSKLGYMLAAHDEKKFQKALGVIEEFLSTTKLPERPKARAIGRASLAVPTSSEKAVRGSDELPGEAATRRKK